MFKPEPWAAAFVNSAGTPYAAEQALEYVKIFCSAALSLPGYFSGKNDADRLGRAINRALASGSAMEPSMLAGNFVQLMLRKGCFTQYKNIIRCIEKIILKQKGIEEVFIETAADPEEQLLMMVQEKAKKLTGAKEVILSVNIVPGLIGGLRLRWGSMVFDGSIRHQLQKMAANLGAMNSTVNHEPEA